MTQLALPVAFADVVRAAERVQSWVQRTPTVPALGVSDLTGATVCLKLETLQRTGAFKERGAANKLLQLDQREREGGVIAISAGNHAQAVAYQCERLGIAATIVMPETTPFTKIRRTQSFGARVVTTGETLVACDHYARELMSREPLTMIHPYDDAAVIAGQGTVALEMLADAPEIDVLIVPIGGGGLIAGMAVAARELRPAIEIVGVQTERYPSYHQLRYGIAAHEHGQTIADGIAVKTIGALPRAIADRLVDDVVLVSETQIERAIYLLLGEEKQLAEGAGAAGVAALLAFPERFSGRNVGLVICGGNIDTGLLANVIMRSQVREGRVVRMRVQLSDKPGTLADVARILGEAGANILDVAHHRLFSDVPSKYADLDITIEVRSPSEVPAIIAHLAAADYPTRVLASTA
ncbi:MAG: threonine ammonia-lyase [Vulcanimicrobiaceae bacterium]